MQSTTPEIQTATLANGKKALFESETCGRCGGGGYFNCYGHINGGRCFSCNGTGVKLTKRGRAASEFYNDLLSKRADELGPGDKVRDLGDGIVTGASWRTVVRVRSNAEIAAAGEPANAQVFGLDEIEKIEAAVDRGATVLSRPSGSKRVALVYEGLVVECEGLSYSGYSADHKFRVARTGEFKRDAAAKAREFQATLTKSGQPRKR